jgi:hypothetical protein
MKHRCDNCGEIWNDDEIEEVIGDLSMRLTPGGVCPSGECRECGALVYPYGPQEEFVAKQGNHCPFCDSRNIMAHPVTSENFDSGRAWLSVECHDCGKLWHEQYKLVGFEDEEEVECPPRQPRKKKRKRKKKRSSRT